MSLGQSSPVVTIEMNSDTVQAASRMPALVR
jgi:hypothetical protein